MVDICFGRGGLFSDRPIDNQFPGHQGGDDQSREEPAGGVEPGDGREGLSGKGFGRAGVNGKKYFLGGLKISSNFV